MYLGMLLCIKGKAYLSLIILNFASYTKFNIKVDQRQTPQINYLNSQFSQYIKYNYRQH